MPKKQTGAAHEGLSQEEKAVLEKEKQEAQQEISALKNNIKAQSDAQGDEAESDDTSAELLELKDQLLRMAAEAENVKKRAALDVQKARDFSIESFARDIVEVLENLYRASEAITDEMAAENAAFKAVKDGVEITQKEMLNVFERHHLKRVNPVGEPFDHNLHQAMAQVEDASVDANTVVQVIQAGYTLKGRLLRPALVNVSKRPS